MRRADATRTAARNSRHCGGDSGTGSAMRRRCCLRASRGIGIASRSHESAAEADSEVRRELGFDRFQPADVVDDDRPRGRRAIRSDSACTQCAGLRQAIADGGAIDVCEAA
ncbi:hypothetical protein [Burkholderia pseudomallei]